MPTLKQWIDCVNLPVAKCNKYRERHGLDALPGARATEQVSGSCVYRGELARIGECDLCSMKGQPFDLYLCEIHGECSLHRRHSKVKSCAACLERSVTR